MLNLLRFKALRRSAADSFATFDPPAHSFFVIPYGILGRVLIAENLLMARRAKKKDSQPTKDADALEPEVVAPEVREEAEFEDDKEIDLGDVVVLSDRPESNLPLADDDSEEGDERDESERETSLPTRYDSLSAYLAEISRHSALDRDEELAVAKRYYDNKDLDAAYRLVVSNLWLVVKISREYERAARNLLDVIQEGNIGLMEAVKNFDPYRGVRFPSYAVWWIKAYILRFIIANWRMVKIGTTQAQRKLFFNLKKEKERLEREGFYPAPKLLAEKLNVRESDILEMEQRLSAPDVSVHAPLGYESDMDYLSVLPAQQPSAEDTLEKKELQSMIEKHFHEFAETLSERDRVIFNDRLLGEEKVTLNDLAEKFSLSKERVRQLETRIRDRLKEFMTEKLGGEIIKETLELGDDH